MKKYKQTCEIKTGSDKAFDVTKLKVGDKFMWNGEVCVRTADWVLGNEKMLGTAIGSGLTAMWSDANECSPFVGTVTITQEEE